MSERETCLHCGQDTYPDWIVHVVQRDESNVETQLPMHAWCVVPWQSEPAAQAQSEMVAELTRVQG